MAAVNYGTVAIVPKGEYDGGTQYNVGNLVSYNGSSYVAKMIPPVGTLPTDTSYWQLSAQGGGMATENDLGVVKPDNTTIGIEEDGTLKSILTSALLPSTDTSGLLGQADATVNTQALIDAIADKIMTKLVTDDALTTRLANYVAKSMMTGIQVNSSDKVPTSALAYAMNDLITGLRTDVDSLNSNCGTVIYKTGTASSAIKDYVKICDIQLLAGHSYLVLIYGELSISVADETYVIQLTFEGGTVNEVVSGAPARINGIGGGGGCAFKYVSCKTNLKAVLEAYCTMDYNINGSILAIQLK